MIVRILGEGQYRLESRYLDQLNALDNRLVALLSEGADEAFQPVFDDMLRLVREQGEPVPVEELVTSEVVLPDPSSHPADIKPLFTGEGLVPG
jgi:hypothetical protein